MCEKINTVMFTGVPTTFRVILPVSVLFIIVFPNVFKINSWLTSVFGDQPVPHFEVTTRTVDLLHQLAQLSEARCSDTSLLVEDLKQKASEYEADGKHQL